MNSKKPVSFTLYVHKTGFHHVILFTQTEPGRQNPADALGRNSMASSVCLAIADFYHQTTPEGLYSVNGWMLKDFVMESLCWSKFALLGTVHTVFHHHTGVKKKARGTLRLL